MLSITKNCETLIKPTYTKPQKRLDYKLTKSGETFSIKPSINLGLDFNGMVGLTCLEVYNCFFFQKEEKTKFEFCTDTFDEFSFAELKDELEEILDLSNITSEHLKDKTIGPRLILAHKKLETEKRPTDGYYMLLMGYGSSPFRDFESHLRIVVCSDEDEVQLVLKQHNSNFVTHEISPGIYSIKDNSGVVYTMGDHEKTLQIKYDDICRKTKRIFKTFW